RVRMDKYIVLIIIVSLISSVMTSPTHRAHKHRQHRRSLMDDATPLKRCGADVGLLLKEFMSELPCIPKKLVSTPTIIKMCCIDTCSKRQLKNLMCPE
ncbi:hypothetical protein PMAYCL1PPCAC_20915, partial [Pristionchus mayeri]